MVLSKSCSILDDDELRAEAQFRLPVYMIRCDRHWPVMVNLMPLVHLAGFTIFLLHSNAQENQ